MDLGIAGRLALVTGASRGIGRAIADKLASEGARVVLAARSESDLEIARAQLASPESHVCVAADLMTDDGIAQLTDTVTGLGPLDIVVHNLGGSGGVFDAFASADDWARVWRYNVGVGHELNRRFIPGMVERRWGRIVHITTLSTTTYSGNSAYVSAKCALDGYVKNISRLVARHNVVVSAVAPGAIYSEGRYFAKLQREDPTALDAYFDNHLPTRRLGQGSDVAVAAAFLCSDDASFMAGSIVAVDGGGN